MYFKHFSTLLAIYFSATTKAIPITPPYQTPWSCNASTRLVYQFPLGTWIENIAIRSNGQLLVTDLTTPQLFLIDPLSSSPPILVHTFPKALGLTGIAEVTEDVFAISSTNVSLATLALTQHSSVAWSADFRNVELSASSNFTTLSPAPVISEIAPISDIEFPNGQCLLSSSESTVLIGDIRNGTISRLDTLTGVSTIVIFNNVTMPAEQATFGITGVNGIHILNNILYLTNTGSEIFVKIPINKNGTLTGNPTIITRALEGAFMDDFALRGGSAFLVTGSGNTIARVGLNGDGKQSIIAGALNSTVLAQPTAATFGRMERDRDVLYVVTAGGLATPVIVDGEAVQVGAQVVAVDLRGCQF